MVQLLLIAILALSPVPQGIPAQQSGTVTGVLKDAEGKPLPGIRMAAVAKPESLVDALAGAAMSSIAETDAAGRFTLENIPPGRYLIAAGRLDLQTYYPGTPDMTAAKDVVVAAGSALTGIDFSLHGLSMGRAPQGGTASLGAVIPIRVTVDGGGRLPVSGNGRVTVVKLEEMGGRSIAVNLGAVSANVSSASPTAFNVTVQNLPETHVVKSMTYGSTNLRSGPLQLTAANIPTIAVQVAASVGGALAAAAILNRLSFPQGPQGTAAAYTPPSTISIVLAPVEPKTTGGVRVSGRTTYAGVRTLYLSGIPGNYYSDGTFEVLGVPPGIHVIATSFNPSGTPPLAASLVVGAENLDGVMLQEATIVPESTWERSEPRPAGARPPGIVPLARVTGTIREETSRETIKEGSVILRTGRGGGRPFPINAEGRFELPPLLPGTYELEVQIFGHSVVREPIEIADADLKLELAARKLY